MTGARTAVALYVAVALHAVALLFLLLAPVPQTGAGPGVGLTLAGLGSVLAAPGMPSVRPAPRAVDAHAPNAKPVASRAEPARPKRSADVSTVRPASTPPPDVARDAKTRPISPPEVEADRVATVAPIAATAKGSDSAGHRGGGGADSYFALLRTHLAGYRRTVSDSALGRAEVRFTVLADGRAADIALVRSSGSSILDAEALALVARAQPLPPPPRGEPLRVQVPVYVGG